MSDVQISTQAKPDESFGRRANANVETNMPDKLQASLKQDMSASPFRQVDIINPQTPHMLGLRDQVPARDTGTATTYFPDSAYILNMPFTGGPEHLQSGMAYKQQFLDANTIAVMGDAEVIDALEGYGLVAIADRLKYLYDVTEEDEEDVKLNSLRGFAVFIINNRNVHTPQITVTDDGLIQAVWKHPQQGTLVMDFQESDDIAFTLLYGRWDQRTKRHKLIGELPQDQAMLHVKDFIYDVMRT